MHLNRVAVVGCVVVVIAAVTSSCTAPDTTVDAGSGLAEGFTVAQHGAYFPIDARAIHAMDKATVDDVVSCAACHDNDADSFAELTCVSCHQHREETLVDSHQDLRGYRYESALCLGCHETGESPRTSNSIDPETHEAYFPIGLATPHGNVVCGACHAQMPQAWTDNACASCHLREMPDLAQRHDVMRGFVADSAACKTCHADGRAERVADHTPFRISGGSDHDREPCLDCHVVNRVDKPWARDFTQNDCRACHDVNEMNAEHRGEDGYVSYNVPLCVSCHPSGRK